MNAGRAKILLRIARDALRQAFHLPVEEHAEYQDLDWLQREAACFITLTQNGRLRGCIGSLHATRSLLTDVRSNALAAAFDDNRFPPLSADELDDTQIEISLLSPPQQMSFISEQDALSQLLPDVDGIVFESGIHRSTFLPQVWESLHEPKDFLNHLKLKAGLPEDYWSDDVSLYRYTVSKWREDELEDVVDDRSEHHYESTT